MAALEKRFPRESFTKKLERICQRLDEAPIRTVAHRDFFNKPATSRVEITSLWVVGSYARGAMTCGDLDLVLEYEVIEGPHPASRVLAKSFFGALQYVRYYYGTPEDSTSGVLFPDAVHIWGEPGCDWRKQIASITPDPNTGRAERETDSIPLRAEQLYMAPERLKQLVAQEKEGIITWSFVEITQNDLAPIQATAISDRDRKLIRVAPIMGKKSQVLIPAIIRLMAKYSPFGDWDASESHRGRLRCGATVLHLGRPSLPHYPFDDEPTIEQFVLIPHISAKGPNGAWIIRRGPKHPDVQALARKHAFFLATAESPDKIQYRDHSKLWSTEILELFNSREEAEASAAEWDDGTAREIRSANGLELISLFALVDVIEIGDHRLPITHSGASYFDRGLATMEELLAALPSLP
ncbi:hypothetical protein KVG96_14700 [Pseudomonas sp. COR58]|uniref:Polymerase nucleotidyl transferase domain-containing protein n=1 Tax=Pseudomonas ekonensis TaxID=2842353 RepID=A0ABS6PFJ3_9PSED|nr:hypothetical protein [Pseudomonas ekonensis]MBV4459205.1 hypothetical protein [Pseudomonas ekonensis]